MQPNCEKFREIIDTDFEIPFDEDSFILHLESCSDCKALSELKPPIEERLASLLIHAAPISFTETVLKAARKEDLLQRDSNFSKVILMAATIASFLIAITFVLFNRNSIYSFLNSAWIQSGIDELLNFSAPIKNILGSIPFIAGSPLVLALLIGSITLIWAYCILKLRETIQ